jgi:glycerol uptake facilitator-like aquaporin
VTPGDSGWIVIATGWGLAVICGVLVALAVGLFAIDGGRNRQLNR